MEDIHSYAQLSFPGQKPRPDRVMSVDVHRAAGTGVHLIVSDVVISGDFELHITLTSTQAAHLAGRLDEVTRKAGATPRKSTPSNLTLHVSGSVQMGEGQPPVACALSVDVQMLSPADGSADGTILTIIADSLSSSFTLHLKLTAMQASQLAHQLTEIAQDAQHATSVEKPVVIPPG